MATRMSAVQLKVTFSSMANAFTMFSNLFIFCKPTGPMVSLTS